MPHAAWQRGHGGDVGKRESRVGRRQRLEREAMASPRAYARKLLAVALLGYGALVVGMTVFLLLPLAVLATVLFTDVEGGPQLVFLVLPLLVGVALLRALWFGAAPPEGIAIHADEAPLLHAEVERVRVAVGAPPLAGIVVDGELNAGLATAPRAGGLLGHGHTLVLGLPLMRLLDYDELAAVVAHEFGHVDPGSAGFDSWIHRMRVSLLRLAGDGSTGMATAYGYVLQRALQWYAPYLEVFVRARSRELEFQADAAAVHATSVAIEASTSLRLELAGQRRAARLEAALRALARQQSHPPAQPHVFMAAIDDRERLADPARILAVSHRQQHEHDSHPLLQRRLDAIGARPALREPGPSALARLGDAAGRIERALEAQARDALRPQWDEWRADAERGMARLRDLERRDNLSVPEAIEHAGLVADLRSPADGVDAYRRVAQAAPGNAAAHLGLGTALLAVGEDREAIDAFQRALALDADALRGASAALDATLRDPDLPDARVAVLEPLQRELAARLEAIDLPAEPHADLDDAGFLPHALDSAVLEALAAALSRHPKVARAWVVRRRMPMEGMPPHFVVLVDWRGSVAGEAAAMAILRKALALPGSHAVCTGSNDRSLAAAVRAVAGPVYQR